MKRFLLVMFFALGCIAPGAGAVAAEPDRYAQVHTVAVVSVVGGKLHIQTAGMLPVNADEEFLPISDWGIDRWMVDSLSRSLATRFSVKHIDFDREAIAKCDVSKGCPEIFKRDGVDAVVVVHAGSEQGVINENLAARGLGLYFSRVITSKYSLMVHASYSIDVIDAKSGAVIGTGSSGPTELLFGTNDWPNKWSELAPAQRDQLKDLIANLIEKNFPSTISAMKLPPVPSPGGPRILAPANDPKVGEFLARTHTVAVVSGLGDQLHFASPGNAFHTGAQADATLPASFAIDNEVETLVRNIIGGRFAVVTFPTGRAAIAKLVADRAGSPPSVDLPASDTVDAYVVIMRATDPEGLYPGLGMTNFVAVFSHETTVYADYVVALIDARTLKPVANYYVKYGEQKPCAAPTHFPLGVPQCVVDRNVWPDSPDKLTEQAVGTMHARLTDMFNISIPETLLQLGLK